jgi:tRNA (cytidine/uridine-2'-O-)-methyltransferase
MFHLVLLHPEIPPNTGNAMRLAANTGCTLHLIEPLGFELSDSRLRRAGMDYRDRAVVRVHARLDDWYRTVGPERVFALAVSGTTPHSQPSYRPGDAFLFGPESVGLGEDVLALPFIDEILAIPMRPDVRSLNLSNSVAVVTYEAWRQVGFTGARPLGTIVGERRVDPGRQ